jgi:pimeloyl-ACP methyl ester carboxylesterase
MWRALPGGSAAWRRWAVGALLGGAVVYLSTILVLLALEDRLLFNPRSAQDRWLIPPPGLAVRDVWLACADGTPIHAWWSAPPGWQPAQGAVLFFHGKGGNVSTWVRAPLRWQEVLGQGVLLIDYPGYGRSGGRPTEAGCYAAADAAYDWLTGAAGVPAGRVVLYGFSFGGAVATDLAARRPHRAFVLVGAFASFPDMAQHRFPWLPARYLVRNRFDSLNKIGAVRGPVFVAHAAGDRVVPFRQGRRLFEAAPGPKRFLGWPGGAHTNPSDEPFYLTVREFLDAPRN